jgi:hypothetical protein
MKPTLKIAFILIAIFLISISFRIIPLPKFIEKYLDELDKRNEAQIDSARKLGSIPSNKISLDYLNLLDTKKLTFRETLTFKNRNPVSKFKYGDSFVLQICKLDTLNEIALDKSIIENHDDVNYLLNVPYAVDQIGDVEFDYNNSKLSKTQIIYLSLSGMSHYVVKKNDSIAYYYSKMNSFSIQNNAKGTQNVIAMAKRGNTPIEILFIKKHSNLYLLTLNSIKSNGDFDPYLLYNLTNK